MKFKLNGFEKFIIRNHKVMRIVAIVLYCPALCLRNYYTLPGAIAVILTLIGLGYVFMLPSLKTLKLTKFNDVELDINAFIDGSNQMIEATNPKDLPNITIGCANRIVALINIGDFERAETEIRLFWQTFDLKKVPISILAQVHLSMANIALEKRDMKAFNEQMNIVYAYQKNAQKNVVVKNAINYSINGINLFYEAITATEISNEAEYEARVFAWLYTNPATNKPLKKEPSPMTFISAYDKLTIFYKNKGNTEKATYYAQQLVNIGNEQIIDYRRAKEYLENANRSN